MNKIAKTALMTGAALCVAGAVLSVAGYFAGGKDFTYASDHFYVSGGNSSDKKDLAVMEKKQIDDFTKLDVDFSDLDLDIRTSDDNHYYMEYKLEKNGKKDPLIWEDKDGKLTLKEYEGSAGSYYVRYDLGIFRTHVQQTETQKYLNTVILYVPENAELSDGDIRLSDGDLTTEQLLCEKLTVKLSCGDMDLDKGKFKDFKATFGDGDFYAGDIQAEVLKLKNSSGDVTLKKTVLGGGEISLGDGELQIGDSSFNGDMDISNSDGDVFIEMKAGSVEKTNIHLETTDGDVDASGVSEGRSSEGDSYSVYENKVDTSAPALNVKCGDGDITLTESVK